VSRFDDVGGRRAPWTAGLALFALVCGALLLWQSEPAPTRPEAELSAQGAELEALRAAFAETQEAEVALDSGNLGDVRGHLRRAQTNLAELMAARGQAKDPSTGRD